MHELSIAEGIVDIVHQYVPEADTPLVRTVFVKVGALAGVVPDSLEFGFTAITADTLLKHARLHIDEIPYMIECNECHVSSRQETGSALCPRCGSIRTRTLSGTELQVTEIEMAGPEEPS